MAEEVGASVFNHLAAQINELSGAFREQCVVKRYLKFEGDPKKFKDWITQIEKTAVLSGLNDDRKKLVAYQTAQGAVSDFIQRYMGDHPAATWVQLS